MDEKTVDKLSENVNTPRMYVFPPSPVLSVSSPLLFPDFNF